MTFQAPKTARATQWQRLRDAASRNEVWDLLVIGGGATGLGVAVDAANRGLKVALVEAIDYAKGTSSRATKLLHGGVRYLAQGDIGLVREALHERTAVLRNAPSIAQVLPFVMPSYRLLDTPFYGIGLKMYDALAGRAGLGDTEFLSRASVERLIPNVAQSLDGSNLKGGVKYFDAQFDDARLAWCLAATAIREGACVINHCRAESLLHEGTGTSAKVSGARVTDAITGESLNIAARCVVNATGVWVDALRLADAQALSRPAKPMVAPSQGVHLVVDKSFWPSDHALLVPKTADGRVLFAVPWLGSVILGTTDTPRETIDDEPEAQPDEVSFILNEAARYMTRAPGRGDVKSIWAGLRPLVKPVDDEGDATKKLSREHTILVSKSGLLTVTGGKWTTYRAMAEDVLNRAEEAQLLPRLKPSQTATLELAHSPSPTADQLESADGPEIFKRMVEDEQACTVEDLLARRSRVLFLDAARAQALGARAQEALVGLPTLRSSAADFDRLARQYRL
jgi:glycerol-3-phosphate dehydrogenase